MASSSKQTFNSVERAVIDALANNSDDVYAAGQQVMIIFQHRTSKRLFKTSAGAEDFATRIYQSNFSELVLLWMFASQQDNLKRTFNVFLSLRFCPQPNAPIVKIFCTVWPPLVEKILESYLYGGTRAQKILKRAVRCFQTQLVSPQALLLRRACTLHNRWALKFLLDIGGLKVVDQIQGLVDSYPHGEEEIRLEEQLETMSELPGNETALLSLEQRLRQHAILRKEMIALLLHSKQKALCQKESARQRKLRSTSLVLSSTPPPKKKDDLPVVDDLHAAVRNFSLFWKILFILLTDL